MIDRSPDESPRVQGHGSPGQVTVHTVHSAEELRQHAAESHAPVVAEPRPGFYGRFAEHVLSGGISLSEARTSAVRTFRTERLVATSPGKDVLVFCVHSAGLGRILQHERVAELSPGAGVLFESRSAWELTFPADMRSLSLHFPRELLPARPARHPHLAGGVPTEVHHYSGAFHLAHYVPGTAIGGRMINDRIAAFRRLLHGAP
jgi:hypothetical protein